MSRILHHHYHRHLRQLLHPTTAFTSTTLTARTATASRPPFLLTQCRRSSHAPIEPAALPPRRKKVTINTLRSLHASKTPIAMVTAHDFPSGLAADLAGVDMVLVGDSLAMVALGMEVCPSPREMGESADEDCLHQDTNQLTLEVLFLPTPRRHDDVLTVLRRRCSTTAGPWLARSSRRSWLATCPWARTRCRPNRPSPRPSA